MGPGYYFTARQRKEEKKKEEGRDEKWEGIQFCSLKHILQTLLNIFVMTRVKNPRKAKKKNKHTRICNEQTE